MDLVNVSVLFVPIECLVMPMPGLLIVAIGVCGHN